MRMTSFRGFRMERNPLGVLDRELGEDDLRHAGDDEATESESDRDGGSNSSDGTSAYERIDGGGTVLSGTIASVERKYFVSFRGVNDTPRLKGSTQSQLEEVCV